MISGCAFLFLWSAGGVCYSQGVSPWAALQARAGKRRGMLKQEWYFRAAHFFSPPLLKTSLCLHKALNAHTQKCTHTLTRMHTLTLLCNYGVSLSCSLSLPCSLMNAQLKTNAVGLIFVSTSVLDYVCAHCHSACCCVSTEEIKQCVLDAVTPLLGNNHICILNQII